MKGMVNKIFCFFFSIKDGYKIKLNYKVKCFKDKLLKIWLRYFWSLNKELRIFVKLYGKWCIKFLIIEIKKSYIFFFRGNFESYKYRSYNEW